MHGMENQYMGIRWVFFTTCKQSGGQSVFHIHLIPASNRIGRGSRGRALARRLAANAVDANQPSGRGFDRPSFQSLCRGGPTTLPQRTLSSGKDTHHAALWMQHATAESILQSFQRNFLLHPTTHCPLSPAERE